MIITIDQLTYYVKMTSLAPNDVLLLLSYSHEFITNYTKLNPGQFKPLTLLGTFSGDPPVIEEIPPNTRASMCMMTSSNTPQTQEPVPDTNKSVVTHPNFLPNSITHMPFLYPTPSFVSHQVIAIFSLTHVALAIPV